MKQKPDFLDVKNASTRGETIPDRLQVVVKANAQKNEILSFDDVLRVAVVAPADKGKANKELIKFLSTLFKRKVRIKSGFRSKHKVVVIE